MEIIMNNIYISGKITGDKNYYQKFIDSELFLVAAFKCDVFNPAKINQHLENNREYNNFLAIMQFLPKGVDWIFYMYFCIIELIKCDAIYMQKGWKRSKGAKIEHKIAKKMDMEIIYQI